MTAFDEPRFVDGVLHSSVTSDELLKAIRKLDIRDDDVIVVSYPKAGTTWTQEIVSILFYGCDIEKADEKYIRHRFLFLDMKKLDSSLGPHEIAASLPSPRLIKTHLQSNEMPEQLTTTKAKIVFIARNPKDNAVSLFHFSNAIAPRDRQQSWSDFFTDFCEEKVIMGGWFKINTYWWSRRQDKNVLFLKYEDMQKDLTGGIMKISEFFGWPIPDGKLDEIVEHCTFSNMKSNPKTNYSDSPSLDVNSTPFMRKGKVGDWKNYFTVAQNEAFDKLYEEKMKDTGLLFDYEL
ncbi:sulfotransferase 1C4-like [Anneissia japonica]|uniref:sulfotransferase 1C4-like n=1 Tax=Anneissia japonica TaxID=1529436 RepID=UPI0014258CD4|nr:sulfotransferase 1C4-like [Anneissia japonica]XP_033112813.1 sulfotransferase 1C4-like [Anneissia japonica]XP_033112815.1 sulfotransferase 1C4-like [Anneissia japonica]